MAFKYVNPGYAELTVDGGTTVEDKNANPLNGVKYTSSGDNRVVILPKPCPQDLWFKAQYSRGYLTGKVYIKCGDNNGIVFFDDRLKITNSGYIEIYDDIFKQTRNTIVIHWHFSKTNGFIEVQVGDKKFNSGIHNVGDGIETVTNTDYSLRIDAGNKTNYWFNIILADYDISDEQIATAKLTDLTGTWDGIEAGTAKATEVGQVLSQKIDTADLKSQIAAQSSAATITGLTIAGLKMEYDSTKVDRMTGIVNDGSKDVFSDTQVMNSNFSMVCNSYQKDMSIEDVAKLTCSLKAAKA